MRKYSGKKVVARALLIIISLMKTAVKFFFQRGIRSGIINCSYMVQTRSAVRKI